MSIIFFTVFGFIFTTQDTHALSFDMGDKAEKKLKKLLKNQVLRIISK